MLKQAFLVGSMAALLMGSVTAGCDESTGAEPDGGVALDGATDGSTPSYNATVRRTSLGVPHVRADDFGGLGYGYGYAFSEDNVCALAEEILTVHGERSKYFGDLPYDLGQTASVSNVNSDAFYKMLFTPDLPERFRAKQSSELNAMVAGYAAGVSRYVRELRAGEHAGRHASCRDAEWLREVSEDDLYLRFYKLDVIASSAVLIDAIAAAQPPTAGAPRGVRSLPDPDGARLRDALRDLAPKLLEQKEGELGSNMYAFGSAVTGGGGIQFGNPHFPWFGPERLYQVHLTVPGKMNVEGASIFGAPIVLIGFNEQVAWSHTTSTAYRFTPFQLKLKPGDPLTYLQDGAEKPITPVDLQIEVKQADGSQRVVTRRLYRSEYGPMVQLAAVPQFAWDETQAFSLRDANAENFRLFENFFRWNKAGSIEEFEQVQRELVAVPWVNTIATDRNGQTYYSDVSVVPNVSDEKAASCAGSRARLFAGAAPGLPILDGSRAACNWDVDPESPQPGTLPASKMPSLKRDDYVLNCNDSFWLTNSKAPLTGYPSIQGRTHVPQSLRSRLCHQQVFDRLSNADGLGSGVTAEQVKELVLRSRVYSAEKFRQAVLDGICNESSLQLGFDAYTKQAISPVETVPITAACDAIRAWDGHNHTDSRGSLVWDEFWFRVDVLGNDPALVPFATPFDPARPLDTPADLDVSKAYVREAFAAGVRSVARAGYDFAAPRSEVSYRLGADGSRIAMPGGHQRVGNFTIAQVQNPQLAAGQGWGPMTYGNSYLQVVAFSPSGVAASTMVTYSQSVDPASPHFDDFTRRYSARQWLEVAFTEEQIAADQVGEPLQLHP